LLDCTTPAPLRPEQQRKLNNDNAMMALFAPSTEGQLTSFVKGEYMRRTMLMSSALFLFLFVSKGHGQTYTFFGSATMQVNATAGQKVTVTAAMSTNDTDEDGEGEALFVFLPQGPFVVANYFANQSTTFIATQDNPVVSAQIQGADNDEIGRVTFIVQHNRFTDEQKAGFAKAASLYKAEAMLEQSIALACSKIPVISSTCGISQAGAIALSALSFRYDSLAKDPFDPDFTVIPQPMPPSFPPAVPQGDLTQDIANAYNAWLVNQEQQIGFIVAINIGVNRANSAESAGDPVDEQKQMTAAGNYAISLSTLLSQEAGLRLQLENAIQASGFSPVSISPNDVFAEEVNLIEFGFPPATVQIFQNAGFSSDDISFMLGGLYVQDPTLLAPNSFPALLNSADLNSDNTSLANDLLDFAISAGAGTPLAPGDMVQAQGFVSAASGQKTTFATEAHVDPQGDLHGSFTLQDQATGLTISGADVTNAVLIGNRFALSGNYEAADGSTQSFHVIGDPVQQSVTISTSAGFSISGPLGGGNVKVKN
jgi:hypothetical protein